jgi:hypothetical protein
MGRKNTSKAATLSATFGTPLYRFGSYEENSTTVTNLMFEHGNGPRDISAFSALLADTFGVEVNFFTTEQDLRSVESVEVSFHSFADAAAFNSSPNATEIMAAFKQMLATRFGVEVSAITVVVADGSAKFQTSVTTPTAQLANQIQSDFGNPVEVEKMFTTEMAAAVDAQGVSGAALTNVDTFFFRGGDRNAPPEMLSPGTSDFVAIPTVRTASVVPEFANSFYRYQAIPAESQVDVTAGSNFSNVERHVMFPVNTDKVVHWAPGSSATTLSDLPFAFVLKPTQSQSVSFLLYVGQTFLPNVYYSDPGDLSYKYIHNDFSQETEWIDVVFPEYTTRASVNIITAEFDPDTQHVLVKHNDTNQQIAVFVGSIPTPLPAP